MHSSAADTLLKTDDVLVRRVGAADAARQVVTFDSYSDHRTLDRKGFGEDFFAGHGVTAIHVLSRDNDWYQHPELIEGFARIREAVQPAERVMTYGVSMGGYAALRFSQRVGAHVALALSPQYSIDPAKAPFERRWIDDAARIRFLDDLDGPITTDAECIVVYDPTSTDRQHVERIEQDTPVVQLRAPHAGHSVAALLAEAGVLGDLALDVLKGQFDAAQFEQHLRQQRKRLGVYLSELASRQPPHRRRTAVALARRAVALKPDNDITQRMLADGLAAAGEHAEAIAIYESLLAGSGRQIQHLLPFSRLLLAAGQAGRAEEVAKESVQRMPELAAAHHWLAQLQAMRGDFAMALASILRAQALAPANPVYRRLALDLRARRLLQPVERLLSSLGVRGARKVSDAGSWLLRQLDAHRAHP